jgi:hypothetical protein
MEGRMPWHPTFRGAADPIKSAKTNTKCEYVGLTPLLLGTTQNTRHHSGRKIFSKIILAEHPFIANLASNFSIPPLEHNPPFSA